MRSSFAALPLALLVACAHAPAVSGTPTGFEIVQAAPDPDAAAQVARVLPEARERVERWGTLTGTLVVRIQPSGPALAAAAGHPGDVWLRGWARLGSVDVVSPRGWTRGHASDEAVATLLAHELTHCLLFQRIGSGWAHRDVPTWFEEGMASVTAGERHVRADASVLEFPAATLAQDPALAYGTADRTFRYLLARHGEPSVRALLEGLRAGLAFGPAFHAATGSSLQGFEEAARAHLAGAAASR